MKTNIILLALMAGILSSQAQIGTAVRELPYDFHPGDLISVRIQVTPPAGTTNWTVREFFPVRWDFVQATNFISYSNDYTAELVFGPFSNAAPQTLYYEVLSNPGYTNSEHFHGEVVFNSNTNTVTGTTNLPSRNEWLFVGPQILVNNSQVAGTSYGSGRWVASSVGWVTTMEQGGRVTYPRMNRYFGSSRLAYLGGLFFQFGGVSGVPLMSVSEDGISWKTTQSEPGSPYPFTYGGEVFTATYGNGIWLAGGSQWFSDENDQGAIFKSTNGINWKRVLQLNNPPRNINGIAYTNGLFLAVANRGTLLVSSNGQDWSANQPITVLGDVNAGTTNSVWWTRDLLGICYGPSGWIIPTSATGTSLQSSDGITWTPISSTGYGGGIMWNSFYADGKYWFSSEGNVYTTVNGTSWTRLANLAGIQPSGVVNRSPDGVTPRYLGSGGQGGLVASDSGTSWSESVLYPGEFISWARYPTVVCINNEWVVCAQPCDGELSRGPTDRPSVDAYWIPLFGNGGAGKLRIRDGAGNWRDASMNAILGIWANYLQTSNGLLVASAVRNQLFAGLLVGTNYQTPSSSLLSNYSRAVDPQKYKARRSLFTPANWEWVSASITDSPLGYDLCIESYCGINSEQRKVLWGHFNSSNGTNWVRRSIGLNNATNYPAIRGLVWGAGRFVAVSEGVSPGSGASITTTNRIFTSTNGENYLPVNLSGITPALTEGLTGVAFADGKFLAIGAAGRMLYSTNGLDWITVRQTDGHRWNRIRHTGGIWAAVGDAGWVAFSHDGQFWISKTVGAESDLTDIASQNGQFMVVGSHAMVLTSLPVTPPSILVNTVSKQPNAGLQFDISGQLNKLIVIETSGDLVHWSNLAFRTNNTGTVTVTDNQPNQASRFYRALQLP